MRWQDDPLLAQAEGERRAHMRLLRSAAIWSPPALVLLGALLYFTYDRVTGPEHGATWFLVGVLVFLSFLVGFQAMQPILDLIEGTREVSGFVLRRWSRTDSLVLRSHYVRLETKNIFRVDPPLHLEVKAGDYLKVRFYPHSALVVQLEKVAPPEDAEPPALASL
ncbi:MAG: hypothetical protein HY875_10105 [Chloroflexi bacterium]|nr:hypothetical protein [Chloroflexota bacterium]